MATMRQPAGPVPKHAAAFVFVTVLIDAMGLGIIIPVMPDLLQELSGLPLSGAALWGGYLSFVYALMQFFFGPTVGNLSDRFGRRPVLLTSLAVLTVDYLIMATATALWVLFIARLIAGIAGATYSTANAFMADVSAPGKRAQNFGLLGAAFGLGFVIGPVLGGLAGEIGTRAPFYAAAALAFVNLLYGALVLPESLAPENRRPFNWRRANPLGVARRLARFPMMAWFFAVVFLFDLAHFVYPAVWSFYTKEAFAWSSAEVGLSLAIVGIGFAVVQGWLIRVLLPRLGPARTVVAGLIVNVLGFACLGFATQGWMVYALMPFAALGAIVTPALTGLMSNATPDNAQGELQGAMTSVAGITIIISPLMMTQLFGFFSAADAPVYLPGAPFLAAALLTAAGLLPLALGLRRMARGPG